MLFWIIIGVCVAIAAAVFMIVLSSKASNADLKQKQDAKNRNLTEENSKILAKGRSNLLYLRQLIMKISDAEVKEKVTKIGAQIEKILRELKAKPHKIPQARQFFNYYIPTLGKVLVTYERLEHNGIPGDEMTDKVSSYLSDVSLAMEKQYEALFTDDILDMSVEMEAMTNAVRRDGLLENVNMEIKDGEKILNLTL